MVAELVAPSNRTLLREGDYTQNIFGSDTVIPDHRTFQAYTSGMEQASPHVMKWLKAKVRDGTLNDALHLLVTRNYAPNAQAATVRLAKEVHELQLKPTTHLCDLTGSRVIPRWQRVAETMKGMRRGGKGGGDLRRLGTLSHSALSPQLLSGLVPSQLESKEAASPSMFHEDSQLSFCGESWGAPAVVSRKVKPESGFLTDKRLVGIQEGLTRMRGELPVLNGGGEAALVAELVDKYPIIRQLQNELRSLLSPILGEDRIKRLSDSHDAYGNFLAVQTLMSWAAGVVYAHETGKNFLASEVPVLHGQNIRRLSGGRLDLLEILSVDEKHPSQSQLRILAEAVRRRGFQSVGPLAATLMQILSSRLDFAVLDLKFQNGDAGGRKPLSYEEITAAPQKKDQHQMSRYLTAADLDIYLHRRVSQGNLSGQSVWPEDSHFKFGNIAHFFAEGRPIEHIFEMDATARQNFFREDILPKLTQARNRALVREVDNFISTLVEQPRGFRCQIPAVLTIPMDLRIEEANPYEKALQEVIDGSREFIDENGLVERRYGRNGKPYNVFHLNKAIEMGWISRRADLTRDVNIPCPLPGHPRGDRRPSARLYHDGHVYCFVHGEGMLITEEEVPDHLSTVFKSWSGERRERAVEKWHIPAEHTKFMNKMQEILQYIYRLDERGRMYLAEERCLDPDLAFHYGAGFANNNLIAGLLDSGYTLEDMAHFGVLEYSPKVDYRQSMGPFLEKLGLKRDRVIKTLKEENPNKPLKMFPVFALEDRVTFPLEGRDEETKDWSITNFYGRSIDSKKRAHHKLSVSHTGVAAGGFNVRRALDSKYGKLYLAEAAIDALSAIELGYEPTAAVIGLHNATLVRLLVDEAEGRGLELAAVFDFDEKGRERTMSFVDEVRKLGFTQRVIPFTNQFFFAHPERGFCKDINGWKVRRGKGQIRSDEPSAQAWIGNYPDPFGDYPVWQQSEDTEESPEE